MSQYLSSTQSTAPDPTIPAQSTHRTPLRHGGEQSPPWFVAIDPSQ